MILNALTRRYDSLAAASAMPRMGWTRKDAAMCAELNEDGGVELLTDLRDEKGNARAMDVPEFIPHNNIPTPNVFYDNTRYALGAGVFAEKQNDAPNPDAKFKSVAARNLFALHFKPRNLEILNNLKNGRATPMTAAFRRFLEEWNPDDLQKIVQQQGNIKWRDFGEKIVVFRLADAPDEFLHQSPAAADAYEKWRAAQTGGKSGVCMVTGKTGPIINSHPKILGDAYLVSFSQILPAFSSHGWTQGENAPVGSEAAHKYASVLREMLKNDSGQVIRVPNKPKPVRIVFWPDSAGDDGKNIADAMGGETGDPFNRPDWTKRLRNFMERWRKGGKPGDPEMRVPFFILGLSEANKARLSVRLWLETTIGDMRRNVLNFYDEADIGNDSPRPPLFLLRGLNNAAQDDAKKQNLAVPEKIKGEFFSAILSGGKYPRPLLAAALNRFQNDRQGNDEAEYKFRDRENARAALVKAILIRNHHKEITPMLNRENPSVPYQLGRLFAVLESVQRSARGESPNATIRDRFIGGALSRPADVFPQLLKLAAHHMRGGHWGDEAISEIQNRIPAESEKPAIPRALTLEEQGMFLLGYYHQREQNFRDAAAAKKRKNDEQLKNSQSAQAEKE